MQEAFMKMRATAYLKLVTADLWVVPPHMFDVTQKWLISAYAAEVGNLAKYELVLNTDAIKEANALADEMNSMVLNLHSVLDAMQMNETKEIPVDFFYHDKFKWYEKTTISIARLDKDSFKLIIKGDDKTLYDNPLISKHEVIDAVSESIESMLDGIRHGIESSPLLDQKILYNAAQKLRGDQPGGQERIDNTVDINLADWPYLPRVALNNKKFLSNNLEDNTDERTKLMIELGGLKDLGDHAGPFNFKDGKNNTYTLNIMVDPKGAFNIELNTGKIMVLKDKASIERFLNKNFLAPIEIHTLSSEDSASMVRYLEAEYPAISKIKIIYENQNQETYGGLWDPSKFTLYVRPLYPDPIQHSKAKGGLASEHFAKTIQDMRVTIRHELQHFAQSLAAVLATGRRDTRYGMPSKKTSPFAADRYDDSGLAKNQDKTGPLRPHEVREDPSYGLSGTKSPSENDRIMLEHPLRDVEYQTRLADEIDKFKDVENKLPRGLKSRAIKIWTGDLREPLIPFAEMGFWDEFRVKNNVGGQFILDFFKNNKISLQNIENSIKNRMGSTIKHSVDREKFSQEMYLLKKINALIRPATFFSTLKQVSRSDGKKDSDRDVGNSRWARAVGSFVKEVS